MPFLHRRSKKNEIMTSFGLYIQFQTLRSIVFVVLHFGLSVCRFLLLRVAGGVKRAWVGRWRAAVEEVFGKGMRR